MRYALAVLLLLALAVGCTKIDYIGEEYPPTSSVEMFFSADDVERDYKVMGHLVATADDFVSAGKMQKKIMETAREKGADGVIILGLDHYVTGESTTHKETSETSDSKKGTKTTTTAVTSTDVDEKKEIRATFIKYR